MVEIPMKDLLFSLSSSLGRVFFTTTIMQSNIRSLLTAHRRCHQYRRLITGVSAVLLFFHSVILGFRLPVVAP